MKTGRENNSLRIKVDILLTMLGIVFTTTAALLFSAAVFDIEKTNLIEGQWGAVLIDGIFIGIALYLVYGGLVYLVSRLGYFRRRLKHIPASTGDMESIFEREAPSLTVLIPSYKEEKRIVAQTLMSAALQNYPDKRVVLLIDDQPFNNSYNDAVRLEQMRGLPGVIQLLFEEPARRFSEALEGFRMRCQTGSLETEKAADNVLDLYAEAAAWFDNNINSTPVNDHTDAMFKEKVLIHTRDKLLQRVADLKHRLQNMDRDDAEKELLRLYSLLSATFGTKLTSFERKQYENMSHEPNKAMNLNSYIGLIGRSFAVQTEKDGRYLVESGKQTPDLHVPGADYIITLDADSLLLPEYALRLIHMLEQPGNERIAIAQTPYSAVPHAKSLERVAGATTDIQYIIHQGFTQHNATYWVGANALLRKSALDDIATSATERGHTVTRYIQDRTVIEDTESTIDLVARGWSLYNYPERLSYSATPPDFGSLIIQRRRWANGGLIILPKLLKYLIRRPLRLGKFAEGFLRFHYLTSPAVVNFGVLILMSFPFAESIFNIWLPLSALPYFILYSRDLAQAGYRAIDVLRVYALNLMLIPVNIGGVVKSIQQGVTGLKIPFSRTPKVKGRVTTPPLYVIVVYGMLIQWTAGALVDLAKGYFIHGVFVLLNAGFLFYSIKTYMGLRESRGDVRPAYSKMAELRKNFAVSRLAGIRKKSSEPLPQLQKKLNNSFQGDSQY